MIGVIRETLTNTQYLVGANYALLAPLLSSHPSLQVSGGQLRQGLSKSKKPRGGVGFRNRYPETAIA